MASHHSKNFTINANTVGKLLAAKGLAVPPSQRSYRWKTEHVKDLYDDINAAIDKEEYFLGSIVSITGERGRVFIYDGQQRLATTMILIAAIRDYFLVTKDERSARILEQELLISERLESTVPDPHFVLNDEDADYFQKRILHRENEPSRKSAAIGTKDSHKRINGAAVHAKKFVKSLVENRSAADANRVLNQWILYIKNSLTVTWVQVGDEKTAFTIFETMNDRGLKLSAADLLKNYLHATAEDRRGEIMQKWATMTGVLGTIDGEEDNIVEYIRCYWITRHGHTRTKDLYDEIKRRITNAPKAIDMASDLENEAQNYAAVIMASHERLAKYGEGARLKISTLSTLGVTQIRPLLLAGFLHFPKKEFLELLSAAVSWSVRMLIYGVPSGNIETPYSKAAYDITQKNITTAREVQVIMAKYVPDDKQFLAAVGTARVSTPKLARYYLRAMQKQADGKKDPQYVLNTDELEVTLEHILPVKPGTNWPHFTEDDHKAYLTRLGNLALLQNSTNSADSENAPFGTKRLVLQGSAYSLTKDAGKSKTWGKDDIDARQTRLAELAVKTWPLL